MHTGHLRVGDGGGPCYCCDGRGCTWSYAAVVAAAVVLLHEAEALAGCWHPEGDGVA